MGHGHSKDSLEQASEAIECGRLERQEVIHLVRRLDIASSVGTPVARNALVTARIDIEDFFLLFPAVVRPFVSILLPKLREYIKNDPQITHRNETSRRDMMRRGVSGRNLPRAKNPSGHSGEATSAPFSSSSAHSFKRRSRGSVADTTPDLMLTFQELILATSFLVYNDPKKLIEMVCSAFSGRWQTSGATWMQLEQSVRHFLSFVYIQTVYLLDAELPLFKESPTLYCPNPAGGKDAKQRQATLTTTSDITPATTPSGGGQSYQNSRRPCGESDRISGILGEDSRCDSGDVKSSYSGAKIFVEELDCLSETVVGSGELRRSSLEEFRHTNGRVLSAEGPRGSRSERRHERANSSFSSVSNRSASVMSKSKRETARRTIKGLFNRGESDGDEFEVAKLNSWDCYKTFWPRGMYFIRTAPTGLDPFNFEPLLTSCRLWVEEWDTQRTDSPESSPRSTRTLATPHIFQAWVEATFPFVAYTILAAFKTQVFGTIGTAATTDLFAAPIDSPPSSDTITEPVEEYPLPERTPSIQKTIQLYGGWQGQFLLSRSYLLTDDMCATIRQCSARFSPRPWIRLFASWAEGSSFSRLAFNIVDYPAPSIIVIRSFCGQTFGGCCSVSWRENGRRFFGDSTGFLFEWTPRFRLFRSTGLGENYCYLNSKNKSSPKGIGFGGQVECFRLWLSEDFYDSYATSTDRTYHKGQLIEDSSVTCLGTDREGFQRKFEAKEIEVWGCGDEVAYNSKKRNQATVEQVRYEKRRVDRARLVENEFDREYILGQKFSKSRDVRAADM